MYIFGSLILQNFESTFPCSSIGQTNYLLRKKMYNFFIELKNIIIPIKIFL